MEFVELCRAELTYRWLEGVEAPSGTQFYGVMEGTITGDRLRGRVHLTNLARRRSDGVNLPTLRGLLTTEDDVQVWLEWDGIAVLREADHARVFVTACRFQTGGENYAWLNTVVGVLEGVLDTTVEHGTAQCRMYECRPTLE